MANARSPTVTAFVEASVPRQPLRRAPCRRQMLDPERIDVAASAAG
jgi:hypothetical protein